MAIKTHNQLGIFCLTVLRNGVFYKVCPTDLNHRMEDYVFAKMVKTEENNNKDINNNINFDECNFGKFAFIE